MCNGVSERDAVISLSWEVQHPTLSAALILICVFLGAVVADRTNAELVECVSQEQDNDAHGKYLSVPCFFFGKSQRVKNAKGKNFRELRGRNKCSQKIFQKISQKIEDIAFTGLYSISGYLRNLRGRLLSSEKFSEIFTPYHQHQNFCNTKKLSREELIS